MGLFDYFRKRREERERIAYERRRIASEQAEARKEKKRQERENRRLKRLKKKEHRRQVAYNRIHFWVESRIGILEDLDESEITLRLISLLTEERANNTAHRLHGNMEYDPYAGLEAYILSNSYRRMLSGFVETEEAIVDGIPKAAGTAVSGSTPIFDPDGQGSPAQAGAGKIKNARQIELMNRHPTYGRLQYWIEERIGPLDGLTEAEVRNQLDQLLQEERARLGEARTKEGEIYDLCRGLEAYIRSGAWRKLLDEKGTFEK